MTLSESSLRGPATTPSPSVTSPAPEAARAPAGPRPAPAVRHARSAALSNAIGLQVSAVAAFGAAEGHRGRGGPDTVVGDGRGRRPVRSRPQPIDLMRTSLFEHNQPPPFGRIEQILTNHRVRLHSVKPAHSGRAHAESDRSTRSSACRPAPSNDPILLRARTPVQCGSVAGRSLAHGESAARRRGRSGAPPAWQSRRPRRRGTPVRAGDPRPAATCSQTGSREPDHVSRWVQPERQYPWARRMG